MKYFAPLVVLVFELSTFGQRSIDDLEPLHRDALKTYLKTRPTMSLRLESEYLVEMMTKGLKANYAIGDFNRDKRLDFAVLLTRAGKPRGATAGEGESSDHFPDFPMHLVVFNGGPRTTFKPAFSLNFYGPRASFIQFNKKAGRLYYGVFETDNLYSLLPRGSGYRLKYIGG